MCTHTLILQGLCEAFAQPWGPQLNALAPPRQGMSSLGHSLHSAPMHSLNTQPWLCHPRPLLLCLWVPPALQAHVAGGGGTASHVPLPPGHVTRPGSVPISLSPPSFPEWESQCSCQLSTSTSLSITPCATTPACHMPCPHPQHSPGEVSLQPCPWKG